MPVRFQKKCESGAHVLVWEVTESELELLAILPSTILTDAENEAVHLPQKRREMLASRVTIQYLANLLNIRFDGLRKDENGKPFLVNCGWQMSITHSKNFMAIILHPNMPVGIDIEQPTEKLRKVQHRLFSETEIADMTNNLSQMCIYWSAKEALYKLYGKRGTDFKQNLKIHKLTDSLLGEIIMPDHTQRHRLNIEKIDSYYLVWAI